MNTAINVFLNIFAKFGKSFWFLTDSYNESEQRDRPSRNQILIVNSVRPYYGFTKMSYTLSTTDSNVNFKNQIND